MTKTQPNILLVMADQLSALALPCYGNRVAKTPHLDRLAREGVVFENAYCPFPLCAPSRMSMMTGCLPTRIGAFDNAAEFPASLPTFAHFLADAGYRTSLSGKMHFVGPDQLHGFEERLTTDIYPATFAWTPDWGEREFNKPSGISMRSVVEAGPCVRSLQVDYDEEVEFHAVRKLYDLARRPDERPFLLTASFTHPHPPFVALQAYWDRYTDEEIDMPAVGPIALEAMDPLSRWLHFAHGADLHTVTDEHVRRARRAYFAMTSYIDDKLGRLLRTLEETGLADDTLVVFTADHGEMLGERGMWYKQAFFEGSARVPLIFRMPARYAPRRIARNASLVDLPSTFLRVAGHPRADALAAPLDGHDLSGALGSGRAEWPDRVICEYTAEGAVAACRMLRQGRYKYVYIHGHGAQLFDLERDPHEREDLSGRPEHAGLERELREALLAGWSAERVEKEVRESQARRLYVQSVRMRSGRYESWDYQAHPDDAKRYVRDEQGATNTKALARFPYVEPTPPDRKGRR